MSFVTDIRAVSDGAIEQIADRFADLPRPLLAAIGAGDLAVEQWAALRESIIEQLSNGGSRRVAAVTFTTDLPARAQQAATEYAGKAQQAATDYVGKAQQVAGGLATPSRSPQTCPCVLRRSPRRWPDPSAPSPARCPPRLRSCWPNCRRRSPNSPAT